MSRIYEALKRGEALEASRRSLLPVASHGAASVDLVAEGYQRVLHTAQARCGAESRGTLLFVSATHGEGTSTVAREFAILLAREGAKHVVLLDANLRTPSQHKAFAVERGDGLTEVVVRGLALDAVVRNGNGTPVPLVTCGRPASHPTEILSSPQLRAALQGLRERYDWVIADAPPATVYSDAGILGSLMEATVLVVQAERTRWQVADQAKRNLEESGARLLGAVLNRRRFHIPQALYDLL